jgi:hypothetical protein
MSNQAGNRLDLNRDRDQRRSAARGGINPSMLRSRMKKLGGF